MATSVTCFWCEPIPIAEESFRRFVFSPPAVCPLPHGYHDATVTIGDAPWPHDHGGAGLIPDDNLRKDPRWPAACACGYVFKPDDQWQHHFDQYYRRTDTGERFSLRAAPPGAMWNARWYCPFWAGPDGISLVVMLPDGIEWAMDVKRADGGWTRTGTVPRITAHPSIATPGYHGWLRDGVLVPA